MERNSLRAGEQGFHFMKSVKDRFVQVCASFFYIGYLPVGPGTFGSLAGLALAWYLHQYILSLFIVLTVLGLAICKPSVRLFSKHDSQHFVLDEVAGMLLSVLWLPLDPITYINGFLLFRILDTFKPWPIILLQRSKSAFSIMTDDLAAGLAVNLILRIFLHVSVI